MDDLKDPRIHHLSCRWLLWTYGSVPYIAKKKLPIIRYNITILQMKFLFLGILDIVNWESSDLDFWKTHGMVGNLEFVKINFACDTFKNHTSESLCFHNYF